MSQNKNFKCTTKLIKGMNERIGRGGPIKSNIRACGIVYATHRKWLQWADEIEAGVYKGDVSPAQQKLLVDYRNSFELARAEAEIKLAESIIDAGTVGKDWRASAFILERSYGWRAKNQIEHSGRDGGPITTFSANTNFDPTNPVSAVDAMAFYKSVLQQPSSIDEDDNQ